jgi:AcrR family transcriptional regulator
MDMATTHRRHAEPQKAPQRMRKADRKSQLLAQAKHLFVTLGYHCTTTQKIAQAAGVSEPVLYRHFESKKALFLEVLGEIREATLNRWNAEIDGLADPLAKLQAIAQMYLGTTREHALEFRVIHRTLLETEDQEVAGFLRSYYLDGERLLTRVIADGQQSGVFRKNLDPAVGAWELIRTALAYTLTLPLGIPLYQEPDYQARAIDCLLQCLTSRE